ncbi:MAG TPA: minor capsid protein [Clostridia bacterium]|nr:minor capsid protein [Clostridia bacterium]
MAEISIAQYIAANTDLVLGADLFLAYLPEDTSNGVVVRTLFSDDNSDGLAIHYIFVIIIYENYEDAKTLANSIKTLMKNHRGTTGSTWSVKDKVVSRWLGQDNIKRNIFEVSFQIVDEE